MKLASQRILQLIRKLDPSKNKDVSALWVLTKGGRELQTAEVAELDGLFLLRKDTDPGIWQAIAFEDVESIRFVRRSNDQDILKLITEAIR